MTTGFRPLTRIHLLLTENVYMTTGLGGTFPTSDEDSSTPDKSATFDYDWLILGFRPLTRIHLLLTLVSQHAKSRLHRVSDL